MVLMRTLQTVLIVVSVCVAGQTRAPQAKELLEMALISFGLGVVSKKQIKSRSLPACFLILLGHGNSKHQFSVSQQNEEMYWITRVLGLITYPPDKRPQNPSYNAAPSILPFPQSLFQHISVFHLRERSCSDFPSSPVSSAISRFSGNDQPTDSSKPKSLDS